MYDAIRESVERSGYVGDLRIEAYTPFGDQINGFHSIRFDDFPSDQLLAYTPDDESVVTLWPLPDTGRKPGHGLFLVPHLGTADDIPAEVLDLGCGDLLFHGMHAAQLGADLVVGVDKKDPARQLCEWVGSRVHYVQGDIRDEELLKRRTFDLITTHPPMIPTHDEGLTDHDVAGPTGREVLDQVIKHWTTKLNPQGQLVIGQFDFLGLMSANGEPPSTAEVLESSGLTVEQVHTYEVPITDTIRESMSLIQTVYPDYPFERRDGSIYHGFSVVNARMTG